MLLFLHVLCPYVCRPRAINHFEGISIKLYALENQFCYVMCQVAGAAESHLCLEMVNMV